MSGVLSHAEIIRLSDPHRVEQALRYLNQIDEENADRLSPGGRTVFNRRVLRNILLKRIAQGQFTSISEVATIRGVGVKTLARIFDSCSVEIFDQDKEHPLKC